MEINTPFLRLILSYYGNLSIQLRPIRWRHWGSLANALWNILLMLLICFIMFYHVKENAYQENIQRRMAEAIQRKPLFALLYKIFQRFLFPAAYGLNMLYFVLLNTVNGQLVALLDSFRVHNFECRPTSRRIFAVILLFDYLSFLVVVPEFYWPILLNPRSFLENPLEQIKFLVALLCEYMLNLNILVVLGILHYQKYATLQSLQVLRRQMKDNKLVLERVHFKLQQLAETNSQLNRVLSFPVFNILFIYLFSSIITIASLSLQSVDYQTCIFLASITANFLLIAVIDKRIDDQLEAIDELLKSGRFQTISEPTFNCVTMRFLYFQSQESALIKANQIVRLYRAHFQQRLFNLCAVNLTFWFGVAAFIVNYVVLVTQTNNA